jgi:hypothetical protein
MAASCTMNIEPPLMEYGPWNPGLGSEIPPEYLPLSTMFRNENVSTSIAKAQELSDYCGLPITELVAFLAERLIVHELLIHVTTSLSVPDGGDYEDLGRNFRRITSTILDRYIAPHRGELTEIFERFRSTASVLIEREIARTVAESAQRVEESTPRWRHRLFGAEAKTASPILHLDRVAERDRLIASDWGKRARTATNRLDAACLHALSRIATGVMTRHGRLVGDKALLSELALTLVCNDYGSEVIGDAITPFVQQAASREGYGQLPPQEEPVVMNVKGASASGKSSMRPFQRILARRLDLQWEEFALISPDIWRKFLLDYTSLGPAYKYAAMLTGHELEIIDRKLDRRMKAKAESGEIPHLVIDRFRFDSFVPELEGKGSNRLLTRFGTLVYMFFLITPPEMTVERAWKRALKVGRYKAVEDLLAHNIEAFAGMPELFFTWALAKGKRVHYEFLDNSVPQGQPPRTVAFGWNGEMTILNVKSMLDVERFRKINVRAKTPEEIYLGSNMTPECNVEFLKRCSRWIPIVNFADFNTGRIYGRLEHGKWIWRDEQMFSFALNNLNSRAGLKAIAPERHLESGIRVRLPDLGLEKAYTIGAWGESLRSD